jgi:alpha-glucosidase
MLALVRNAIAARPAGELAWVESPPGTIAFRRGDVECLVNVEGGPVPLPAGSIVLASEPVARSLEPAAAVWIRVS